MINYFKHIHLQAITNITTLKADDTEKNIVPKFVKRSKNIEKLVNANVVQLSRSNAALCTRKKFADGIHTATTNLSVSYFPSSFFDMSMRILIWLTEILIKLMTMLV